MSMKSASRSALFLALACCLPLLGACAAYDAEIPQTQAEAAPPEASPGVDGGREDHRPLHRSDRR